MTNEEFQVKEAELLNQVPVEFRSALTYMVYVSGHAYGYQEVLYRLGDLIDSLSSAIEDYATRIKSEVNKK